MSAPKKPVGRPPCVATSASPDARPRELAPTELELLAAYAGMTPWARENLMYAARAYLGHWPINRAPALRLVVGGAS